MRLNLLIVVILLFTSLTVNSSESLQKDSLWIAADKEALNLEYQESLKSLRLLSEQLDSVYKNINSQKAEDLRQVYSIDELEIENNKERNHLIKYTLNALLFLSCILLAIYLLLRYQEMRLSRLRTRMHQAKIAAENSMHNKSLFLSNMSHEIRTPLNALSGFSSLLTEPGIDEATRLQCNEVIQQNSKMLLELINDVVDTTCLDIDQLTFTRKECNVVSLCQNVVNTLEGIKQTSANIVFQSTCPSLLINTDTVRLQQVLINIIVNATKFTKHGSIVLSLEQSDEKTAQFSITDTGCGIPREQQDKIFARFEKLNEKAHGSGIGLSICKLIINQLGGNIWIDSDYTDGTRFVFTHPLKQIQQA